MGGLWCEGLTLVVSGSVLRPICRPWEVWTLVRAEQWMSRVGLG